MGLISIKKMSRKSKGTNAERELVHIFHSAPGWSAVRVAGSGSSHYPCPDIIAANGSRYLAIECKATRDDKRYLEKADIDELKLFAQRFGAEAWVAARFVGHPWYFLKMDELEDTGTCLAASKEIAQKIGRTFTKLICNNDIDS